MDPPGCTDIDDALHCRDLPNGNLEVGVHIADLSYFMKPGTALDKEAAVRTRTVYLVDTRIHMVPGRIYLNNIFIQYNFKDIIISCNINN